MSTLSWNCCGLGNPQTIQFLKDIVYQKRPDFIFLSETRLNKDTMERIAMQMEYEGCFCVEARGQSGGTVLMWKDKNHAQILGFSVNHIDVVVKIHNMIEWRLTGIYGEPNRSLRHNTWSLLRSLKELSVLPWCVIGDFNNILHNGEKRGGKPYPNFLLDGFNNAVSDCDLTDLDLIGHQFTWEKSRGSPSWTEIRLDRAMVNSKWWDAFQSGRLFNLEITLSDHCPIFMQPVEVKSYSHVHRFRFENAWLTDSKCMDIVKENWSNGLSNSILEKLERCKFDLDSWGKSITGNFRSRINECKILLKKLRNRRDSTSILRYKEIRKNLAEIYHQKEVYWRQRSKQLWLQSGDRNTKYFHNSASKRRKNNLVHQLKDDEGSWRNRDNGLHDLMENYFHNIFSSMGSNCDEVIREITPGISEVHNSTLVEEVSRAEVKAALFSMDPDKAPGKDGYTPGFYQKCWPIVGEDVTELVNNFFKNGKLPINLNDTVLVLIPKKKSPVGMGDLRPIALCNVLYKIIGKVMANRLKTLLPLVISENQSAFMKGRLISDNVLISFEVLHYLKRKQQGKTGFMALKLDLSKAYDRMEWHFLEAVMKRMGFCDRWVELVMECVTSVKYSITHGGEIFGQVTPSRGIRQGGPLSPYLFILCAEGLSSLIRKYEREKWLHGCKIAQGAPVISHMLFADDSYIFCRATVEEASCVLEILRTFENAAGQKVNLDKSSVFFSKNTGNVMQNNVIKKLEMRLADDNSLYLGLPSTIGRNKSAVFGSLKDKIRGRIQGWDGRWFSGAGKEVLIKMALQSIPTYTMSVFLLPNKVCLDIESLISNYWWKSSKQSKGIHWCNWDKLSRHKNNGGMGFKRIRDFNIAMLGKQGWRLLKFEDSLVGRVFKAKYYPHSSFLEANLGRNPSYVWRSILEAQTLLKRGARWRIGDGRSIAVTAQPWLTEVENPYIVTQNTALEGMMVHQLFRANSRAWDEDIIEDLFVERDRTAITDIVLRGNQYADTRYWFFEQNGNYSVKSAYNLLQRDHGRWDGSVDSELWKNLWKLQVPMKVKVFLWRALNSCLPTKCKLQSRMVQTDNVCPLCGSDIETTDHCLIHCLFVKSCWNIVCPGVIFDSSINLASWFLLVMDQMKEKLSKISMVCWSIWKARNDVVWNNKSMRAGNVVSSAIAYLTQWERVQSMGKVTSHLPVVSTGSTEQWAKPDPGSVKINCDAALFKRAGQYGVGYIARNDIGEVLYAASICFVGRPEVHHAEAIGIKESLSWIKAKIDGDEDSGDPRPHLRFVVESDSQWVVNAVLKREIIYSPYGSVIDECRSILESYNNISIVFVKRSGNKAADCLASMSYSNPGCIFRGEPIPHDLSCILEEDLK